jgi:hypothetical protein
LRLRAAAERLTAQELELRDPAGGLVPTESIVIHAVCPPGWLSSAALERAVAEAREEGLEVVIPGYLVVVRGAAGGGLQS